MMAEWPEVGIEIYFKATVTELAEIDDKSLVDLIAGWKWEQIMRAEIFVRPIDKNCTVDAVGGIIKVIFPELCIGGHLFYAKGVSDCLQDWTQVAHFWVPGKDDVILPFECSMKIAVQLSQKINMFAVAA